MIQILFIVSFVFGQLLSLVLPQARWSLLDVFVLLFDFWYVIQSVRSRKIITIPKLWPWVVLYVAITLAVTTLRVMFYPVRSIGFEYLYIGRWFAYSLLYRFIVVDSRFRKHQWTSTLYWTGVVMAIFGLVQLVWYPYLRNLSYLGWDPHLGRVFSSLFDPNFVGIIFVFTILLGMSYWELQTSRLILIFGQVVTCVALLFTYSRSSYIAFIVGMIAWFVLKRSLVMLSGILVACIVLLFSINGTNEGQHILRTASSVARIGSARIGLQRFIDHPVLGTGFVTTQLPSRAGLVDTSLLFVLSATGILGFLAFSKLTLKIGKLSRVNSALFCSLMALLVHSIFINSLFYPWVMAWVWILLAETERGTTVGT